MMATMSAAEPMMYQAVLYDDSFNRREYVARVLMMVCYLSEPEANAVMMRANRRGGALIDTFEEPVALHIVAGLTKAGL